jgi:NADH-quinone oxidoreductase subunit N
MMPTVNFSAIAPEIVVLCGASAVLMLDLFVSDARRHVSFWLTQIVLLAAAWASLATMQAQPSTAFAGMVADDMLADTLKFMVCGAVSLGLFYSRGYCVARGLFRGETFVLALFSCSG